MAGQLWAKGEALNALMHQLTVGDDPALDLRILPFDCIGSAAHARMLNKIGLLSRTECARLLEELQAIYGLSLKGKFSIAAELEDCHTAIESALTAKLGDVGKKIHAGRSRNDQIVVTMRLFMRSVTVALVAEALKSAELFSAKYEKVGHQRMPGYTHFQSAMPGSVGMWLHAFIEGLLWLAEEGFALYASLDQNPLGAAAGFGSGLPLDREYTAALLGFSKVQRSFIDVQNSRGRCEERLLFFTTEIAGLLEKFATDMVLFTSSEFGFFSLPVELTTGSSIMPQKRNPDLAELLRGRAGKSRGAFLEVALISSKLPSSYHRDFQLTKAPLMRGIDCINECFQSVNLLVEGFRLNKEALEAALVPELFATYEAYRQVQAGAPFRSAYQETARLVTEKKIAPEKLEPFYREVLEETERRVGEARTELALLQKRQSELGARLQRIADTVFMLE